MRIPGRKTLVRNVRRLRSRFLGGAVILGYHRVAEGHFEPSSGTVSYRNFSEQLDVIRKRTRLLPLSEIACAIKSGGLPAGAVGITFDDGYADLLECVKPLLIKHEIPATVFATPGYLGREFWWEELRRIADSGVWPEELELEIGDRSYRWTHPKRNGNRTKRKFIQELEVKLEPISERQRRIVFDKLRDLFRVGAAEGRINRSLTAAELLELCRDGMIDIGSHSMTHRSLATLPAFEQQFEIKESRESLEKILGMPVSGFSYPNGVFSGEVRARVQQAGYRFACGSYSDAASSRSDLFHLPRLWIPDCDGESFGRWLRKWHRY